MRLRRLDRKERRRQAEEEEEEDAITFGSRLRFVDIALYDDQDDSSPNQDEPPSTTTASSSSSSSSLPWPCLQFANVVEMLNVLQANNNQMNDRMSCPHLLHRITVEYLRHLQDGGGEDDAVVFLFGKLTPRGNRLIFDHQEMDTATTSTSTASISTTPLSAAAAAAAAATTTPTTATPSTNNDNNSCFCNNIDSCDIDDGDNDNDDQKLPPAASLGSRRRCHRPRRPLQLHDYKDAISAAVDQMQGEPCFMDALNETSPILAALLSEEMLSPNRLPGPEEHAPAA